MLHALTLTALGATALAMPQQSAQEILETMRARQLERAETVDNYTVFVKMSGIEFPMMPGVTESGEMESPMHYQKHEIEGRVAFGMVEPDEYVLAVGQAGDGGEYMNAGFFEAMGDANRMMADGFEAEMRKSGAPMFLPGMNEPGNMLRENAAFADASAEGIRETEAKDFGRGSAAGALAAHDEMMRSLRLVGREKVGDREAFHLRAEGLNRVLSEPGEDYTFTMRAANVWIDVEHYVILRTTMEGDLEADGESRAVTMEQLYEDYKQAGPLYESYRQVMRMSGLMGAMDPKQREELEKARQQMEEMEAQLDQMPAAARGMVERQMETARQQMAMLDNDAIEMITDVLRIEINTGPPPPGTLHETVEVDLPAAVLTAEGVERAGAIEVQLTWAGLEADNVDVYRNDELIATVANDFLHTDRFARGAGGPWHYRVCAAGTTSCSENVELTFDP